MTHQDALLLRENTGTTGLEQIVHVTATASADLISLKLDSSNGSLLHRLRDKTHLVELITRRNLPRDLAVAPAIRGLCQETLDALKAET